MTVAYEFEEEYPADAEASVPEEHPLAMPVQSFDEWHGREAADAASTPPSVIRARALVFTLTLALTVVATWEMISVISVSGATALQVVFAGVFAVTFLWIALPCASALLGFACMLRDRGAGDTVPQDGPLGRNVLIMPVYNEDPEAVCGTLERMGRELAEAGAGAQFDIFILSDTRDGEIAAREEESFERLRAALHGAVAVYYRRRADNWHRKAGNVADFVCRWGGRYDHMVVLDADSYMAAPTLVALARRMASDPAAGIVQTVPMLAGGTTLFARMQQFAGRYYGPVIAHGLAAWHGRDGNYWGHNAIIRVRAFAESAGLPELKGRRPFGGHVLSHDFVEAALMRRAGWAVIMLPSLGGSYEQCPPSLITLAQRDRRWAQGNLQHMKIVGARGLHWMSRLHLVVGIMSYLASPLWLAMLLIGLLLSIQARFATPDYFPDGLALFPHWPAFDYRQALVLFVFTMGVLVLPKILGAAVAIMDRGTCARCGGAAGILFGVVAETLLSALLAPVMMLLQTRWVAEVFLGRDSGWNAQQRGDTGASIVAVARAHWVETACGAVMALVAWTISTGVFLWLLPISLGLVLAIVLSWATAHRAAGLAFRRIRLFLIPEEVR